MNKLILSLAAALALAGCGKGDDKAGAASSAQPIAAPNGQKWTEFTARTAEGGMQIGNPNAPVKLIEFGALSCPVCGKFAADSHAKLMAMVEKGTVSYEFRIFPVHGPIDVAAGLLAQCNGPSPFFPISDQMFRTQQEWLSRITPEAQQALQSKPINEVLVGYSEAAGLVDFVGQFGIGRSKAMACLADPAGLATMEKVLKSAVEDFRISGTPTFLINGSVVPETSSWDALEPRLRAAGA